MSYHQRGRNYVTASPAEMVGKDFFEPDDVEISFSSKAVCKVVAMLYHTKTEFGGKLLGRRVSETQIFVDDLFVPAQYVSGSTFETSNEGYGQLAELVNQSDKVVVGWFHSHNGFDAFHSSVDEGTDEAHAAVSGFPFASITVSKTIDNWDSLLYAAKNGTLFKYRARLVFPIDIKEDMDKLMLKEDEQAPTNIYQPRLLGTKAVKTAPIIKLRKKVLTPPTNTPTPLKSIHATTPKVESPPIFQPPAATQTAMPEMSQPTVQPAFQPPIQLTMDQPRAAPRKPEGLFGRLLRRIKIW